MTDETSTMSHMSVAMTTNEIDETQTTDGNGEMSPRTLEADFYFKLAVIVMGLVGAAGNGLVLYALFVSKQHKKLALIVNQNALDMFSSFILVVTFTVMAINPRLSGVWGYWLCIILLSENLIWSATNGSMMNLAIITIDRYLKVVYPATSKKYVRPWVVKVAMAVAWFTGFLYNIIIVLLTTKVTSEGACYGYVYYNSHADAIASWIFLVWFYYVNVLAICIFCYWRILLKIRHQAKVMASHSAAGTSNANQAQSLKIQNNVIKTMIIVCTFYAIAWLPYHIYFLLIVIQVLPGVALWRSVFHAITVIAFGYTCTNPFIYATKFDPVKDVLIKMIPCKKISIQPAGSANARAGPA